MPHTARLIFSGGLGNQLFQYALYLFLKKTENRLHVIPDLNAYRHNAYHFGFEVHKLFNTDFADIIRRTEEYRNNHPSSRQSETARVARIAMFKLRGYHTVYDTVANTPQKIHDTITAHRRLILAGFFQNSTFATAVDEDLRGSYCTNSDLGDQCRKILDRCAGRTTISLHIRRGDYLDIPRYNVFNGLDYYHRAITHFKNTVHNPLFLIFTNDPQWVAEHLHIDADNITVTCNTGDKSYRDLIMMSRCCHNIIANSSFSWWGAWLNPNPDKTVICPTEWFRGLPSSKVVPTDWTQIPN